MTRANFVKKARKDYLEAGIKKGESYYWWKFNFSSTIHRSKTAPRRSQLTQSDFLSQVYDIEDRIAEIDYDNFEDEKDSIISDLENLRDETQEKLDNMPEQLQEVGSGEILSNRVESIEEMINELEGCDLDEIDEDEIRNEVEQNKDIEESERQSAIDERISETKEEAVENSGIHDVSYQGE